jgi:hypothetical protein
MRASAFEHKSRAIRSLQNALNLTDLTNICANVATSMLLCVFGVFEASNSDWQVHLRGAEILLRHETRYGDARESMTSFLTTWVLYHSVLAGFARKPSVQASNTTAVVLPLQTRDTTIVCYLSGLAKFMLT